MLDDGFLSEELLRDHACRAEQRMLEGISEPPVPHVFSDRFEEEMRAAVRRAASGKKKPGRFGRFGRTAACAALVLAAAAVCTISVPTVRAAMQRMMMSWFPDHASFQFEDTPQGEEELGSYTLEYLPAGYRETERRSLHSMAYLEFENDSGGRITLTYALASSGYSISIDNEHSDHYEILFEGNEAHLFVSNTEGYPSFLLWVKDGVSFCLFGDVGEQEILKIAGHIKFMN